MGGKRKSNCIRIQNDKYYCNLYQEKLYAIDVYLQDKQLIMKDLDSHYMEQVNNSFDGKIGHEIEVLPSVYYTKTSFLKKDMVLRNTNNSSNVKLILGTIYNLLYGRQRFNITISVKNIRDKFKIVDSSKQFKKERYNLSCDFVEENKYLDPSYLPYPDTLGKGSGRCVIWGIFEDLELLDYTSEPYIMLSHRQMFEVTCFWYNRNHTVRKLKKPA